MNRVLMRLLVASLVLALFPLTAQAQFGRNKVAYEQFDWQVYEAPHFNVHYYPSLEPFLEEIVSAAESAYVQISADLDHELRFRVPLIVYKTHGEFLQTNIFLSELPSYVGAFAEPIQLRMVLPVDGPPDERYKLIAHELVHIFQYSMFYDGYFGRALRSNIPTWLTEGMASYVADDEDNLDRMVIRDAVVNNILPPIQALDFLAFITYRYGHAIFDYIEQEHGKEGLRGFLFEYKRVLLTNNLPKAIKEAFGYDIDEFNRRFNRYLRRKYFPVLLEKKGPDEYGTEIRTKRGGVGFSPTLSPSGELVAALSAPNRLELDLIVMSAEDGKLVKNVTKGWTNKYSQLALEAPNGRRDLSWSPSNDHIAAFVRREDRWPLLVFDALSGKIVHDVTFDDLFECAGPSFSPDGSRIAFECNREGVVDLFEYNLDTEERRNLTQDDFFDANPWYSADGSSLLYNRRIGEHWKVFSVDLSDPSKKTQLTFGQSSDIQPSYSRDGEKIYFSSDRGPYGIFNIYSLDLASGDLWQYTDVVGGCFSPVEMSERDGEANLVYGAYFNSSFRLYRMPLRAPELKIAAEDRLAEPVEALPFVADMQLSTDEEKKAKYKPRWDLESPTFSIGVADDGTILGGAGLQFSDLLGDQRMFISANSYADLASYNFTYLNLKRRFNWGATIYDTRDFYVDQTTGRKIRQRYRQTGANMFIQYPFSKQYRVEGVFSFIDWSLSQPLPPRFDPTVGRFVTEFQRTSNQFVLVGGSLVGDTTRYQGRRPFQGKRFNLSYTYGLNTSGVSGDFQEARLDYRAYRQVTRRSEIAWRLFGIYNFGDFQPTYGYGGLNELRGYDYRTFFGSNVVGTNLEFRFPLIDELRFPFLPIRNIRGVIFVDLGAAWFKDSWYDPDQLLIEYDELGASIFSAAGFRADPDTGEPIPFSFWDSDENRLQDGRGSYGVGFQFLFLGGFQFNWNWSHRLPHSQYDLYRKFPAGDVTLEKAKQESGGSRLDFYISYDF